MRGFFLKPRSFGLAFFLLAVVTYLGGCHCRAFGASPVYVVDVEKVFADSQAAQAGQAHIGEARKALEKGFEDLRKAYETQPEEKRQTVLSEGASTLSRQLAAEQQAARTVVAGLMLDAVREWRQKNKADMVIARQNLLDAAESVDITADIIKAMDARKPKFAELPTVNVKPPEAGSDNKASK